MCNFARASRAVCARVRVCGRAGAGRLGWSDENKKRAAQDGKREREGLKCKCIFEEIVDFDEDIF